MFTYRDAFIEASLDQLVIHAKGVLHLLLLQIAHELRLLMVGNVIE